METATARVVLKKARTYTYNRVRYIKDVPRVVRGESEIKMFEQNGYFHVTHLKAASSPSRKKKELKKRKKVLGSGKKKKKKPEA